MILAWTSGARYQHQLYYGSGLALNWSVGFAAAAPADAFIDVTLLLLSIADRTLGVSSVLDRPLQRTLG